MLTILIALSVLSGALAMLVLLYLNWRVGPSVRISIRNTDSRKLWFERAETIQRARSSSEPRIAAALRAYIGARNACLLLIAAVLAVEIYQRLG